MSDGSKAVFLSYASQDAEAAKRIADALRAAGIEVWFDAEGGLEHGDEWDAKIRRQIKECLLFIPLISANTQAREEGYFRIEWDLAAERARGIASGIAFILPVVVDDTMQSDALVPDRFRTVQWTKLPGGGVPPEVLQRFMKLWSHRTGVLKHKSGEQGARSTEQAAGAVARRKFARWLMPVIAGGVIALLALVLTRPWEKAATPPAESSAQRSTPATVASAQARQLVAKAWELLNKADLARADWELADSYCRQATEKDANDADAWAAWSQADCWATYHNFDRSPARREGARTKAARALQLAPDGYESRLAHACQLVRGAGQEIVSSFESEAARLLRTLLLEKPDEPRALLALGILQRNSGEAEGYRETFDRLARNPAFATLAWNELGWAEYLNGSPDAAGRAIERSIALQPYWGNLLLKLILASRWLGDLAEAKAALDRLPLTSLQEDSTVSIALHLRNWRREPQDMLALLAGIPRDWMQSNGFEGPTAYWSGLAYEMAGRQAAAELQWNTGLKVVEGRLSRQPDSAMLVFWKGFILAKLGKRTEAASLLRLAREIGFSGYPAEAALALGDLDGALTELERSAESGHLSVTAAVLRLNPILDPLRTLPRFQALQARFDADPRFNPKVRPLNATLEPITNADDRSVAVLAFANLSYDKANEYFSDGISEELLNVLAKVPGLKVTARTSAFHFKGKDTPIPEIAKQLGVAYVVEGSVRKAGDKVRITAQLIKAADGFHVWSDTFTRDLKDVFAVQDEIAGLIAQNLSLKLSDTPRAAKPVNPAAFDLFLEARQYVATVSVANFTRAETLYLKALEIDPDFTRAAAGLAVLRATRALNRCIPSRYMEPELADIERAARDILRRDANVGEAHAALGLVLAGRGQNSEAEAAFAEAGRLGFNREQASHMLAFSLFRSGRPDLAITAMEEARRVNPLAWTPIDVGGLGHLFTRRYARAAEAFQAAARANGAPVTHSNLALALIGLGRNEEAVAAARQALAVPNRADWQPGFLAWSDGLAAWALAQAGARSEAEAVVRRLLAGPVESRYAANYALIELGRLDEAAPTLEDQGGNHGYLFFFLNERPALLADTHIARLLEKLRAVEDFETFRRIVTEQSVPQ